MGDKGVAQRLAQPNGQEVIILFIKYDHFIDPEAGGIDIVTLSIPKPLSKRGYRFKREGNPAERKLRDFRNSPISVSMGRRWLAGPHAKGAKAVKKERSRRLRRDLLAIAREGIVDPFPHGTASSVNNGDWELV